MKLATPPHSHDYYLSTQMSLYFLRKKKKIGGGGKVEGEI